MSVSPFARSTSAAVVVTAIAFGGCNSLLDNRPADPGEGVSHTDPEDAGGALREAGRDVDASALDQPDADSAANPLPPQCAVGTKPCAELCVSTGDPRFGCGGPTCERCTPPHASAACAAAACAIAKCDAGWADCNGLVADGCETDVSLPASCGACGTVCPAAAPNSAVACMNLVCATTCLAGFGDCNANPVDGCETNLSNDKRNCGGCGLVCLIGNCEQGICKFHL